MCTGNLMPLVVEYHLDGIQMQVPSISCLQRSAVAHYCLYSLNRANDFAKHHRVYTTRATTNYFKKPKMSTPLSPKSRRNASRFPVRSRRLSTTPLCDLKSSPLSLNPKSIPSESVWNDDLWAIDATRRLISDLTSILRSRFALIYFIK